MSFLSQALLLKHQRFNHSKNKEKAQEYPKQKQIDWSEYQERGDLVDYNSEGYILFLFNPKVTNCPSYLGVGTKGVTNLVNI